MTKQPKQQPLFGGGHGGHGPALKSWNVAMAGEIVPNSRTVTAFNLVVTDAGTLIFSGPDGTITAAFPAASYLWVEGGT
ncbi:MAG TPA: hypothetical protein VHT68_06275 [Pseudolabrys sp.]|jgi:hypothetical protein|nr:hypothetical protein [Pseudolabrys sp.]